MPKPRHAIARIRNVLAEKDISGFKTSPLQAEIEGKTISAYLTLHYNRKIKKDVLTIRIKTKNETITKKYISDHCGKIYTYMQSC